MEYAPKDYTKHYIVEALFKLLASYEYEKISVKNIAEKAGVGRATFYRYFKRKEDIILFYFENNAKNFIFNQRIYARCKEDYIKVVVDVLTLFKQNKDPIRLLKQARLEYIYLDFLNKNMKINFENNYSDQNFYAPYLYSGMLFNVSMAWLDNDCDEDVNALADMMVSAIYFE